MSRQIELGNSGRYKGRCVVKIWYTTHKTYSTYAPPVPDEPRQKECAWGYEPPDGSFRAYENDNHPTDQMHSRDESVKSLT
ncbi:hypothetical protein WG66_004182 [Moniliophthora roreri]|nr:hypothetical protein WG66_004182 [Moniliophthora roreri]